MAQRALLRKAGLFPSKTPSLTQMSSGVHTQCLKIPTATHFCQIQAPMRMRVIPRSRTTGTEAQRPAPWQVPLNSPRRFRQPHHQAMGSVSLQWTPSTDSRPLAWAQDSTSISTMTWGIAILATSPSMRSWTISLLFLTARTTGITMTRTLAMKIMTISLTRPMSGRAKTRLPVVLLSKSARSWPDAG